MAAWKSPTDEPIRVALLSGHTVVVGPEPREVPDFFDIHLLAAGAVDASGKRRGRKPKAETFEEEISESLTIEMSDDDAI